MLSPALAPPSPRSPAGNAPLQSPTTRRRGLSYLRSLSSRNDNLNTSNPPDSITRTSSRHFFARSSSYQETKDYRTTDGRRRSQSHTRPFASVVPAESSVSLSRVASEQGAENQAETAHEDTVDHSADDMTRIRPTSSRRQTENIPAEAAVMSRPASVGATNGDGSDPKTGLPTIRFFPHQDNNRAGRQSLNFAPVSRTLPDEASVIRVGRYSEREGPPAANPTGPSDAPVGFKSKVVSRKHCEFIFSEGQWQIRDVASSSGTFLNHIRLSQPNQESKLYPVKDGDIVQLGIDFRGGEEMIFRCVKIRIECNRSWQKKPNNFNKQRQAQLRGLAKDQPAAGSNDGECSICLGNVLPCQALFVAPCAHVWHYKCIRPMLEGRNSQYPQFQCPNCRAYADLEADVDIDMDDWAEEDSADLDKDLYTDQSEPPGTAGNPELISDDHDDARATPTADGVADETQVANGNQSSLQQSMSSSSLLSRRQERTTVAAPDSQSPSLQHISMPSRPTETELQNHLAQQRTQTESPNAEQIIAGEGPLTPRNNAGPFVFDGSGSRLGSNGRRHLNVPGRSLDEISDGIE